MALNDTLSNTLSKIDMYEKLGRSDCIIPISSKIIKKVLDLMNDTNYIGKYEITKTSRGEILKVNLTGSINKCGVVKPRFSVKKNDFEKYEKRYLPAQNFGILIVSTSQGIMTNYEAKEKNLGGKLLAYVY